VIQIFELFSYLFVRPTVLVSRTTLWPLKPTTVLAGTFSLRAYNHVPTRLWQAFRPKTLQPHTLALRSYELTDSLLRQPYDCPTSPRPHNSRSYCTPMSLQAYGLTNSLTFLRPLRTMPLGHHQKALTAAD